MTRQDKLNLRLADGRRVTLESRDDYFTIHMENIRDVVAACEAADVKVVTPVVELRPGVTIAIVRDPDGNLVEFLQMG